MKREPRDQPETSYPIDAAERLLNKYSTPIESGRLSLDELARRLSLVRTEEPAVVRNPTARPVTYGRVYFCGEQLDRKPWGTR